jgi:alkylated DNA repair protein (DNA oxidative demethylase)
MAGMRSLFPDPPVDMLLPDVVLLRGHAEVDPLHAGILRVAAAAPFRHLSTRGGTMSVAMTNCGRWGWHSDAAGYRYVERDPTTGCAWPAMPAAFLKLARGAAASAGFPGFEPDCCLINRYAVGAQMGTHRDFDELDMRHPIVSVSIGLPATFLWYGASRRGSPLRVALESGDVLVWGRSARAGYHGVRRLTAPDAPPSDGAAPAASRQSASRTAAAGAAEPLRYNLTFRRAK